MTLKKPSGKTDRHRLQGHTTEIAAVSSACLAFLCHAPAVLGADIRATPHNLTTSKAAVEAEEVCVFCHTPQLPSGLAERKENMGAKPVWQPSLSGSESFVMFDDIGRKQFGKMAVGSQSIACLSCHDASQAFSVTNLVSDHPFGIPYRGYVRGQDRSSVNVRQDDGAPSRPAQYLKSLNDFRLPSNGIIENRVVWWVSAMGMTSMRSRSDLPLYARQYDGGEVPYVECSSCHDPHLARPLFLRVDNGGSKLCLTCHDK